MTRQPSFVLCDRVADSSWMSSLPGSAAEIAAEAGPIFEGIARIGGVINGGKAASLLERSAAQDLVDSLFD